MILVDDGLATGSSMQADVCHAFADLADEVIRVRQPSRVVAVWQWYHNFSEVSDRDVEELLNRARQALAAMQP